MPENDFLRFLIILVGIVCIISILFRTIDWIFENKKYELEIRKLELTKEIIDESKGDPAGD